MVGRLDWGGQDGQPQRTIPRISLKAKETYRKVMLQSHFVLLLSVFPTSCSGSSPTCDGMLPGAWRSCRCLTALRVQVTEELLVVNMWKRFNILRVFLCSFCLSYRNLGLPGSFLALHSIGNESALTISPASYLPLSYNGICGFPHADGMVGSSNSVP